MNDKNIGHVQKLNGFGKPENMKLYNQVKNKIIKSQPKQSGGVKPNLTIKNDIDAVKEEPMSDIIISKYLKNPKIIEYREFKNYNNIDQLLPNNNDYCIILFRSSDTAHWIAILKQNDIIEHFCSYGSKPDEYYKWNTQTENDSLGQNKEYLTQLLNDCKYEVIYNPIKYQKISNDIASCGRFIVMRLLTLINHNWNLNNYYEYLKKKKKEYKLSYDDLISIVVNRLNHDY